MWDNGSVCRHSCLSIFEKVDRDLFLKRDSPTTSSVGTLFNKRKSRLPSKDG
jgi:hypothetical protein